MSAGQSRGPARNRLSPVQTRRWFHRPVLVLATRQRTGCCPGARARRVCASSVPQPREVHTGSALVLRRVVHTPQPLTRHLLRRNDRRGRPAGHPGSRRVRRAARSFRRCVRCNARRSPASSSAYTACRVSA